MSGRSRYEDVSTLLYMVPFLASGGYGLYLWVRGGVTAFLPTTVYLTVTREPTLFILGTLSILLGLMVEVNSTDPADRPLRLASLSKTLQTIGAAALILALISAFYANGFTDVSGAAGDFIIGRYGVVFPAMMVLLSYLVSLKFNVASLRSPASLAVIALLLVPVSLYELGKRQLALGLGVAFVLIVAGLVLLFRSSRSVEASDKK
jgi:hypothetical protein